MGARDSRKLELLGVATPRPICQVREDVNLSHQAPGFPEDEGRTKHRGVQGQSGTLSWQGATSWASGAARVAGHVRGAGLEMGD